MTTGIHKIHKCKAPCFSVCGSLAARARFSQHRLCVSVQMLFTGFSALLFSARACPQHGGRGQGLQRNHHCLHPPVKRQLLDYPLQPRVTVQKSVCVRVLHVLCLMHFQAAVGAFTYFINDVFSCQSTFI